MSGRGDTAATLPPRRDGYPAGPGQLGSGRLLAGFFNDPIRWFCDVRERWGDLAGLRSGPLKVIVCHDLDLLEQVLVRDAREMRRGNGLKVISFAIGNGLLTTDGDEHRRNRRIAAPVFAPRNIEVFAEPTVQITREMIDAWPADGVPTLARDCYDASLRIAGVGLFGYDFDQRARDELHDAMADLNAGYDIIVGPAGRLLAEHSPTGRARRLRHGRDHVHELVRDIITGRQHDELARERTDLLSRLLLARDDDDAGLSDQQLRDEAATMLLAGHDTTAAALGWCLSLIATHPEVQRAIHEELDRVLDGRDARAEDVRGLRWLDATIQEVLRIQPPAYSFARRPRAPIELESGHVLPTDADIVVPVGGIHRDPRHWPDPERFDPSRFIGDQDRHRLAWLPFGAGPHTCIGKGFAMQELVLVLATVFQRFRIEAPDGWQPTARVGFIRKPEGELPLRVVRR